MKKVAKEFGSNQFFLFGRKHRKILKYFSIGKGKADTQTHKKI